MGTVGIGDYSVSWDGRVPNLVTSSSATTCTTLSGGCCTESGKNFEVGDEVLIKYAIEDSDKIGQIRRVISVKDKTVYLYGCRKGWSIPTWGCLEIIRKHNKNKIMNGISIMMKKLLDSDTQTLVKARFINGDLDLTEEGTRALLAILFVANKAEMVKIANERIAEMKEDK